MQNSIEGRTNDDDIDDDSNDDGYDDDDDDRDDDDDNPIGSWCKTALRGGQTEESLY